MFRIEAFDKLGVRAAMTEIADGDCAYGAPGRTAAVKAFGADFSALACVRQVHGKTVTVMDQGNAAGEGPLPEADAIITCQPGVALGVTVADCVPVFLAAPGLAVGLAHAGREGTRQNIAAATVQALREEFGVSPDALYAYIGPGAGICCYAVSAELAAAWNRAGGLCEGLHLDLPRTISRQLCAAGIPEEQIGNVGICSICTDRFFSYRRTGTPARNLALLMF